ncbi:MAG: protein kinase [Arenicellales bacterium]
MADPTTGHTLEIPGYLVQHELGQGGMARVFLAVQKSLEREVALKVLSTELVSDPEFCQRFLKEGKTLARLSHPHVVTIFDSGEHEGIYYMCMELVRGGTLEDRIAKGELSLAQSIEVLKQVAGALEWSHGKGLVHRDIKPGNVLFRDERTAVLSDFGIAKSISKNATRMTAAGLAIGTPAYMSPEQASGRELTARSDQYSLGVMLYEMLTGKVPYVGETSLSVVVQHLQAPVPALPDEHEVLQPIVEKMMAKDPNDRFTTLEEMTVALERACGGTGTASRTEILQPTIERQPRTKRMVLAASGLAAVLLAGGAGAYFYLAPQGIFSKPPPVHKLDPATQAKVKKWLDIAETHFEIGRLMDPPENNAFYAYQKVLSLDPDNAAAQEGLRKIASTYVQVAKDTLKKGNKSDAEALVKEGLKAFPENDDLARLQKQLAQK